MFRPEYYTIPAIEELNEMIDSNGEVWVNDFIVGRQGYGQVKFLGKTDVADLNLDEIGEYPLWTVFTMAKIPKKMML